MSARSYPIIIGMDPAIKNFGYAVARMDHDGKRFQMLDAGFIQNKLENLENVRNEISVYRKEIDNLFRHYAPTLLVIERFQTRHMLTHSMGEKVNMMISIAAISEYIKTVWMIAPGAWKKQINAAVNLQELYNIGRSTVRAYCKKNDIPLQQSQVAQKQVPHCIDATCLGLLYGARYLENPAPLQLFSNRIPKYMVDVMNLDK